MGLEAGNNISDLDQSWPVGSDGLVDADDHFRLIKKILKQQFPGAGAQGFATPILATEAELNFSSGVTGGIQAQINALAALISQNSTSIIPIGGILMYNGLLSSIPPDFQLCDGTNGTPNLQNKFVYGTNSEAEIGSQGGFSDSVNISHNHTFSGNTLPAHIHTINTRNVMATTGAGAEVPNNAGTVTGTQNVNGSSAGTPSGSISVDGSSGVSRNIPPYVKLAYIQRMT